MVGEPSNVLGQLMACPYLRSPWKLVKLIDLTVSKNNY